MNTEHGNRGHGHVYPRPDGDKARCERLRIAAEMYDLTARLASIVQQCGQESLFDAVLLDHFDQLALLSRVVTEAAGVFAGDPNYSPE